MRVCHALYIWSSDVTITGALVAAHVPCQMWQQPNAKVHGFSQVESISQPLSQPCHRSVPHQFNSGFNTHMYKADLAPLH